MSAPTLDRGTSVRVQVEIRNQAEVLTNPDTITCEILNPTGTTYSAAAGMTNSTVGIFLFDKQTAEADVTGMYSVIIRSTFNSLTTLVKQDGFRLE